MLEWSGVEWLLRSCSTSLAEKRSVSTRAPCRTGTTATSVRPDHKDLRCKDSWVTAMTMAGTSARMPVYCCASLRQHLGRNNNITRKQVASSWPGWMVSLSYRWRGCGAGHAEGQARRRSLRSASPVQACPALVAPVDSPPSGPAKVPHCAAMFGMISSGARAVT